MTPRRAAQRTVEVLEESGDAAARRTPLFRDSHRLDPRNNSLNLIRLVFAFMVLAAHSFYTAGLGRGPELHGENLGGFAVFGFFTISGYLITGSRFANSFGTFLLHRLARIVPAFWVCLLLLVGLFGPIGYRAAHGTLEGYLTAVIHTPGDFLVTNAFLKIGIWDISGTPSGIPYPGAWDGSLWTLYYEFLCYLVIGALGFIAIVRRSELLMAVIFGVAVYLQAHSAAVLSYFDGNGDALYLTKLLPFFLGGSLLYMLRNRLPLNAVGALASAGVAAFLVIQVPGWGMQAAAPFATYVILWTASVVPVPRLIQKHDISYGVYIYAFPVQQLLAVAGFFKYGYVAYSIAAALLTTPLAIGSWLLVERPVMRAARRSTGSHRAAAPPSLDERKIDNPPTSEATEEPLAPALLGSAAATSAQDT